MKTKIIKSYSELITLPTFEERFSYLKLDGVVGEETFGYYRYLNQKLYKSIEWRRFKDGIIRRDDGCDLGIPHRDIVSRIILHHINPISKEDILSLSPVLMDPENVICTMLTTHNAIHYGDSNLLIPEPVERTINDTCPWRR